MPATDPIADMLTSIRNALMAHHRRVDVPASRMKLAIAEVLKSERYIENFKIVPDPTHDKLRIYLRYTASEKPMIRTLRRISTPGRRVYVKRDEIPRVLGGLGTAILSTPDGVLTGKEATKRGLGGELVAEVW
ncbi:MAG TPA: 30S ribosomal protein S8 [Candidatus Eisenbacteria bacterium]|nr:30S ribosomal protein S8 [Candidatus Eisenbacteria bacterium]